MRGQLAQMMSWMSWSSWLVKLAGIDAFFFFGHADPAWARLVFLNEFPMTCIPKIRIVSSHLGSLSSIQTRSRPSRLPNMDLIAKTRAVMAATCM